MPAPILIVGQGIAGTALGWEFERAGFSFEIADAGLEDAASLVAAGIVNPITGQRFVKNWHIDSLLEPARMFYREIEGELSLRLRHDIRVRRLFSGSAERARACEKAARGEWAPYAVASAIGEDGFWVEGGFQVDLPELLRASRHRWIRRGILQERRANIAAEEARRDIVILCTGAGIEDEYPPGGGLNLEGAKGEVIDVVAAEAPFEPGVIRNQGGWVLPRDRSCAQVGSTYDRTAKDLSPTSVARATLATAFRQMYPNTRYEIVRQHCGWRMSVPDRRPVVGRLRGHERLGVVNGLSSKGVLTAPWLARQWVHHLAEGIAFDAEVAIERCRRG